MADPEFPRGSRHDPQKLHKNEEILVRGWRPVSLASHRSTNVPGQNFFIFIHFLKKNCPNKKVLLRERKRHTARCVSSARYAGVGVPSPRSGGWYLVPGLGDYPVPGSRGGYPIPGLGGYPIPCPGGVPHPDLVGGYPPEPEMGYPPRNVNRQTFPSINITFPRTTYAGGKNRCAPSGVGVCWKTLDPLLEKGTAFLASPSRQ